MKKTYIAQSIALAMLAVASSASQAVSFSQNDVTLDINGTVNGFYVNRDVTTTDRVTGKSYNSNNSELSNGLLPGWINFVATTQANGQDIKAHISFAPGINSNSKVVGLPIGNNAGAGSVNPYSQIDTRNLYFQFGNKDWGTLKFGRDIGLFGQNVILNDMTLIGVGGTTNASMPYNTTFGMIGHGYMYTGFQAQITYTTPNVNGLQAAVGVFQPSHFSGNETKSPAVQGMVQYDWTGNVPGKVWGGLIHQSTSCSDTATVSCSAPGNKTYAADGQEIGAKASFGNFDAMGYAFSGKGLGLSTTGALFFNGGSPLTGERVKSDGHLVQGTYKFGATKVGLNYGQNKDNNGALAGQIKSRAYTFGVYHSLNKFVTLVGELNQEKIEDRDAMVDTKARSISLGGIIFF